MNGWGLSDLIVYDGNLIAGGHFTTAGDVDANYIASWDGSTWSPLGSGTSYRTCALIVYYGSLIAGGEFVAAGSKVAAYLAKWSKIGTDVEDTVESQLPDQYVLDQNYPNPFNPSTRIEYHLKRAGHVRVTVYNTMGQLVATLVDERRGPGEFAVQWGGKTASGDKAASGVYLYQLQVDDFITSKKMVLIK